MNNRTKITPTIVLVIENGIKEASAIVDSIDEHDYVISVATNGQNGIESALSLRPDIILLNTSLADTTGFDVCRELKSIRPIQDIPVLFLSDQNNVNTVVICYHVGGEDFVTKPVDKHEINIKIARHLRIHRDIELRSRIVEKEHRQAEHIKTILNRLPEGVFTISTDGLIEAANPALMQLLGYPQLQELLHQSISKILIEPAGSDCMRGLISQQNETILQRPHDVVMCQKDGTALAATLTLRSLNTEPPLMVAVIHPISKPLEIAQQQDGSDQLSHLVDQTDFENACQREWGRSLRVKCPISAILIRIDFLSEFTEHYGPNASEVCLQQIALLIGKIVHRVTDVLSFFEDQSIAILLPDTEEMGARRVASHIIEEIEMLAITHEHSDHSNVVTASAGVAITIAVPGANISHLWNLAENVLKRSQKAGHNRIFVSGSF
jgi:diguanylate cyclase (GGDEF)-like protein/PAS domain S-box-containing protein